ncbi:hypothetical protein [Clostridium sp.]|uniref:hypothetical protein n=1 Tax=Clostridium sp. TaxID=1506 RepID=UPI001A513F4E|nr:hypothetical protein [Clostridium sp.]MBK5239780.1 hypothetical protein [Clostridium sp.]
MTRIINKEFHTTFMLSKTKVFNISYYTLGGNKNANFTTSCDIFNRSKTDYTQCGQCQETVLKGYKEANTFYKKWDINHLKELSREEFQELTIDIEMLFEKYPSILEQAKKVPREINFNRIKDFSMTIYR